MSFFGRIKNIFVEKIVDDEFYQPITEHQIYVILNKNGDRKTAENAKRLVQATSVHVENVFDVARAVSEHTPEIEFRLLGYQPTVQTISGKVNALKHKLQLVDSHLLAHYHAYLQNINKSLEFYSQGKDFYSTRKKSAELRFIIEKMNKILCRSKTITRLNIHIKNLKNTLKLIEKVPNIKKMNLMELKAIDLGKLEKTNDEIAINYGHKLLCLTNLSKYITKVNNQSFAYIINNIKMCLDAFEEQVYEEIMRSYLIIQPQTVLQKLLVSLLEEKVRTLFDNSEGLTSVGNRLIELMINVHKIIKWHLINRAIRGKEKNSQGETSSSNHSEAENQPRRRLSITSNQSQQVTQLELNEIVYINISSIKEIFSKTVDNCLTDLVSDNILSSEQQYKETYSHLQIIAKLSQICNNFTGLRFQKLKKVLIDHFNRRQNGLFLKYSKELLNSIEQQKNDWNRLAFPNNFKFAPIDKLLYRWSKITENVEYTKIVAIINKLFSEQTSFMDQVDSDEQETLELKVTRMDSIERLQKKVQDWRPPKYLQLYQGDVIICQSSYKMLSIFQKYTESLLYTPFHKNVHTYYEHMLFFLEYEVYFIFNSLLSAKYKVWFYDQETSDMPIERIYTIKRFKSLYPKLTAFVNAFKHFLQQAEATSPATRNFAIFRKEIREINSGEENQALRAKVIATESCKYCLAYFHQILKSNPITADNPAFSALHLKIQEMSSTICQLQTLLLTQSSQTMVGLQLQTLKTLFQSIRWYQSYEDLKDYVNRIVSIIRESYQRLKSCNRGQIPLNTINVIFIFIWRTILTFSVKLFLETKGNNRQETKLNFQKFIDDLYLSFQNKENKSLSGLSTAYNIFKSIFKILLNSNWQECKELLLQTMKKYDYIYQILINIMENTEFMGGLTEREKEMKRLEFKEQIEHVFKDKK